MTPSRPYFLRAMYEWIVDNNCTPYMLVDASVAFVQVPREHVEEGRITLNLSPSAIVDLVMDNEIVEFNARFGGVPQHIHVPMAAVLGIYAQENGQGMGFPEEEEYTEEEEAVLEDDSAQLEIAPVAEKSEDFQQDKQQEQSKEKPKGRPSLKVVK